MHHNGGKSPIAGHGWRIPSIAFERPPARSRDLDGSNFDQLPAGPNRFALCRYKSSADEGGHHRACEAKGEHERLGKAERIAGEQL
jgi:hypothetical protein